jgi:hypothetical protein
MTLRNTRKNQDQQLETRQAQLYMQIYDKFSSPAFVDAFCRFQETREQVQTIDDYYEWASDPENLKTMVIMATFFEGIGVLVKENLIEMRVVAQLTTEPIVLFWGMFGSIIDEIRVRDGSPRMMCETEYLVDELMKYAKEHPEIII